MEEIIMKTVHEISELTGLSIRTLQYYDKIGLLKPAAYTDSGYRLYGESELETLQEIMLFRELDFPLKDIRRILQSDICETSTARYC
jgi:DNA-binding transcriptional MerR regulator